MTKKVSIVAVLALITVGVVWLAAARNEFFDSKVYSGAVRYWFADGGMVYDWLRPGTPTGSRRRCATSRPTSWSTTSSRASPSSTRGRRSTWRC